MTNPFDGLTALVVADDGLLREDIAEFFRRQGWSVFETAIGAGALQMIREADRVHLLFTDINLADAVTGWDVADAGRVSSRPCGYLCLRRAGGSCPPRAWEYFSVQACVDG
jgi:CheY-like chemotaxis protein